MRTKSIAMALTVNVGPFTSQASCIQARLTVARNLTTCHTDPPSSAHAVRDGLHARAVSRQCPMRFNVATALQEMREYLEEHLKSDKET